MACQNVGELASTENNFTRLLLDGVPFDSLTWGFMNPGAIHQSRNRGPRTVRGGRHTLEAWYDAALLNGGTPAPVASGEAFCVARPLPLAEVESAYLAWVLAHHGGGSREELAQRLGVSLRTLYRLIQRQGLPEGSAAPEEAREP